MLSTFWQQQVVCDTHQSLVGIGFEMVSFMQFKFEFWCEKIAAENNTRDEKRISSRIWAPTLTAVIKVTGLNHCATGGMMDLV
jgi:hypothetical protein